MNDRHSEAAMAIFKAEVEHLCADRPEPTNEVLPPNAWYGAGKIIRDYSGWPSSRPLPVVVPHGVELSANYFDEFELENNLPGIYSFPFFRDEAYRRATNKEVVEACSPWLFLARPDSARRDTILIMPSHSTVGVEAEMNDDHFAQMVQDHYPGARLQCCMYWVDVQHGRHLHYLRRGIPTTSAGHIYDPYFLERLAEIFSRAKLLVTNDLGSHVFYAASHDVPVVTLPDVPLDWTAESAQKALYDSSLKLAPMFGELEPLFRTIAPDSGRQRAAATLMLGADRMVTGSQLREVLNRLWRSPGFRTRVVPQWRLRKAFEHIKSRARRLARP